MDILSIIIAVLLFGFMIFFHELGHFATAKWAGVKVNEFAIGMGPRILSKTVGETTYALRLFPMAALLQWRARTRTVMIRTALPLAPFGKE